MGLRFYDEAVVDKIKSWVKDPNMKILSPNESSRLFQLKAEDSNDQPLVLPLIAISRDNEFEIISTAKKPLTYDGGHLDATDEESKLLNGIPIRISYQLDIYCKYFAEADEYTRNFIFNIINYPNIHIEIPYNNAKIEHNSTLILESTVTDNSDIPERLISGQFTRMSIRMTIDDAYFESLYDDTKALYRLDQLGSTDLNSKADLGPMPAGSIILLSTLGTSWVVIVAYFIVQFAKKKRAVWHTLFYLIFNIICSWAQRCVL